MSPRSHRGFVPVLGHRLEYVKLEPSEPAPPRMPTLVFLHEGLGSLSAWRDFPSRAVAVTGCPALVYSRWGHGQSDPLTGPRRTDYLHVEAQSALPELLAHTGVENPLLVGHSDGATIALIHAGSGFSVRGVVAMAPHVFVEPVTVVGVTSAASLWEDGTLKSSLARHHRAPEPLFTAWNEVWRSPAFRDWNIEPLLSGIRCPLLLIQGENDEYGTLDQLVAIARAARSRVESIALAGVGHSPWRDAPDAVLEAIRDFVAAVR